MGSSGDLDELYEETDEAFGNHEHSDPFAGVCILSCPPPAEE